MTDKNIVSLAPVDKPWSSLDGLQMTGVDTDSADNIVPFVGGLHAHGLEVVAVLKNPNAAGGYLVITYDQAKDGRAVQRAKEAEEVPHD